MVSILLVSATCTVTVAGSDDGPAPSKFEACTLTLIALELRHNMDEERSNT